jgi:hypothetical protein
MGREVHFLNLEYFFSRFTEFFIEFFNPGTGSGGSIGNFLSFIGFFVRVIVPFLIIICVALLIYYFLKVENFHAKETEGLLDRIYRRREAEMDTQKNSRWDHVVGLFQSPNSSDWRVGVIEADAMLEGLVTQLGYEGDNLGEKLKTIDSGNFPTLQQAWDAHLVRNKIAHEGVSFQLSELDKNRVFKLYERVFSDAGII